MIALVTWIVACLWCLYSIWVVVVDMVVVRARCVTPSRLARCIFTLLRRVTVTRARLANLLGMSRTGLSTCRTRARVIGLLMGALRRKALCMICVVVRLLRAIESVISVMVPVKLIVAPSSREGLTGLVSILPRVVAKIVLIGLATQEFMTEFILWQILGLRWLSAVVVTMLKPFTLLIACRAYYMFAMLRLR